MAEYIEREALMKETRSIIEFRKQHYMDTKDYDALEKYLSGIPTADVAPVVRCKDCAVPHNKWTGCPNLKGLVTYPDFYCALGERKAKEGGEG